MGKSYQLTGALFLSGKHRKLSEEAQLKRMLGMKYRKPAKRKAMIRLERKGDPIRFTAEGREVAKLAAVAMRDKLREALMSGQNMDGTARPSPDRDTIDRRERRAEQSDRNGRWITGRGKGSKKRQTATRRFRERVDKNYPANAPVSRKGAVETGLLVNTLAVSVRGGSWVISVHRKRSTNAVLAAVFGNRKVFPKQIFRQRKIKDLIRDALLGSKVIRGGKRTGKSKGRSWALLARTAKNVSNLARQAEATAKATGSGDL